MGDKQVYWKEYPAPMGICVLISGGSKELAVRFSITENAFSVLYPVSRSNCPYMPHVVQHCRSEMDLCGDKCIRPRPLASHFLFARCH